MELTSTIKLKSSDGKEIEMPVKAVNKSGLLKGIIEDFPDLTEIPINQVNSPILEKVKEYLVHYQDEEPSGVEVPLKSMDFKECVSEWDYNYLGEDIDLIFNLINVSDYMDIKSLFQIACAKLGSKIKGMTSDAIKKDFEIPELKEDINNQNMNLKNYIEKNL